MVLDDNVQDTVRSESFPGGEVVKNLPVNAGEEKDASSIPGSGKSTGVGNDNPLQYSCLEKCMDRVAWTATVHGVTKELDVTTSENDNKTRTELEMSR